MNLSIKKDGKWVNVISFKTNQWGNKQVSIRLPLLLELLRSKEEWINLAVFEEKPAAPATPVVNTAPDAEFSSNSEEMPI